MNVIITRVNLYYKFCFLKKCHYSEIVIITDVIITGVTCIIIIIIIYTNTNMDIVIGIRFSPYGYPDIRLSNSLIRISYPF